MNCIMVSKRVNTIRTITMLISLALAFMESIATNFLYSFILDIVEPYLDKVELSGPPEAGPLQ